MRTSDKRHSIYFQLSAAFALAVMVAVAIFAALSFTVEDSLYQKIAESDYIKSRDAAIISSLQEYVSSNDISMHDGAALDKWGSGSNVKFFDVYAGDEWIYTGVFSNVSFSEAFMNYYYDDDEMYHPVQFADGKADVFIYGEYASKIDRCIFIAEVIICFMAFLAVVVPAVRRIIRYICRLKDEIEILEGGNLEYQITVSGNDELSELAVSLDKMRKSFSQQIENEKNLIAANRRLVAEMSHDIRTPLTNLILYLDIVRLEKYRDNQQMKQYICKASDKAAQIREISDSLFEHSAGDAVSEIENGCIRTGFKGVFYDEISEMTEYLSGSGYEVKTDVIGENVYVNANEAYIGRVLGNIASNIVKYADPKVPVEIVSQRRGEYTGILFSNGIKALDETVTGTGIGIKSIRHLMSDMGGSVQIETSEDRYSIYIGLK